MGLSGGAVSVWAMLRVCVCVCVRVCVCVWPWDEQLHHHGGCCSRDDAQSPDPDVRERRSLWRRGPGSGRRSVSSPRETERKTDGRIGRLSNHNGQNVTGRKENFYYLLERKRRLGVSRGTEAAWVMGAVINDGISHQSPPSPLYTLLPISLCLVLCLTVFGENEVALRFPSVVRSLRYFLLPPFVLRIHKTNQCPQSTNKKPI